MRLRRSKAAVKKDAGEIHPAFEQAVREAYGGDVKLKNVKCPVDAYTNDVFSTTFTANDLIGKITLDGTEYNVKYDWHSSRLTDDVHSQSIADSVIGSLPFDSSLYLKTDCPLPMLDPATDSLEKLAASGENVRFKIVIITTEDMSAYQSVDYLQIPEIETIAESSNCNIYITVACLAENNPSQAKALLFDISKGGVHFDSGDHPERYDDRGSKDVFEVYGIKNVLYVDFANGQNVVLTE